MREDFFPQFARYHISEVLGQGGMGTVYKGYHKLLKRSVALKVPHPALLQHDQSRERFLREAQALARLQHPHIVSVYDADVEQDHPYIAMQFVEGKTLTDHIYGASLPDLSQVIAWGQQIADALDYLHSMGVLHRDLKSSNVLISVDGLALITDFGVAHMDAQSTITNGLLGTPAYMSPEQATGRPVDARSDLYSLGVILYESLTGSLPFLDANSLAIIQQIIHNKPPDLRRLRSDIPVWLADVVHTCLRKKPERRFQTGKHLSAALKEGGGALLDDGLTRSLPGLQIKSRATDIGGTFKRQMKKIENELAPLGRSTRAFLKRTIDAAPSNSPLDRMTGLLKPFRPHINPGELVRHPVLVAAVIFWGFINFPNPFGPSKQDRNPEDVPPIHQQMPSEKKDSSQVRRKQPRWQPWPQ